MLRAKKDCSSMAEQGQYHAEGRRPRNSRGGRRMAGEMCDDANKEFLKNSVNSMTPRFRLKVVAASI